jgi:argininosuccinate lyase
VGKKIHTGRSRNDQVLTALRIVERSFLLRLVPTLVGLIRTLVDMADRHRFSPMPGRTHLQAAMPSSVGLWAGGYAEQLGDQLSMCSPVYRLINRCPLGSAAGYGVPLAIDRLMTARLLGFSEVHNNVIAVANSRGELDAWIVTLVDHIGLVLSRLAEDLMLYTLPEFGYFSLPEELCSGSSIMPQKKNPDVLELMRARSATLSTYAMQLGSVVRGLPAGYNRDLQETKEPLLRGMRTGLQLVHVAGRMVSGIEVHESRLADACTPDLYATDVALEHVAAGSSFRDAYRQVAEALADGTMKSESRDHRTALDARDHEGTASRLGLGEISRVIDEVEQLFSGRRSEVDGALKNLLGESVSVYPERAHE